HRSIGRLLYIGAWNYPFLTATNTLIPAYLGGNALLFKPSELTTLSGEFYINMLYEAGVPEHLLQIAIGAGSVGSTLTDQYNWEGVFFTGSNNTGMNIYQSVSKKRPIAIAMELGGKDPLYVHNDIKDIDDVATSCVEGSFYNNGQSCCAVERLYIHKDIYDTFLKCFIEKVKDLKIGDPFDQNTTNGPLARPRHSTYLQQQVEDAVAKGATLQIGGTKHSLGENFYPPTVLTEVNHKMTIMKDESFGPIIGIQKVENESEALTLMQDTTYGLTASIYCESTEVGAKMLSQLKVGTGNINCCDRVSPYLPWSGQKDSGFGHTLSKSGLFTFVSPYALQIRK
ncbi:aldehyde dehydrogenase family protein, partial [Bacteriovoracaceae bacterium]|nr:aldehyde dehydrogenase family protein [Bacteriovoracaceae bacterium]